MIYFITFTFLTLIYQSFSIQYLVAYIFQNNHLYLQKNLSPHQIKIYQNTRYDSQVLIRQENRKTYQQANSLEQVKKNDADGIVNYTELQKYFDIKNGKIDIERSTIPQHMWVGNKQIVIVKVDVSQFLQQGSQNRYKNESLYIKTLRTMFQHKGESFFIYSSAQKSQIEAVLPPQIHQIFTKSPINQTLCKISLRFLTMQQNRQKIQQCYFKYLKYRQQQQQKLKQKNNKNPTNEDLLYDKQFLQKQYQLSILEMIRKYGVFALIYVIILVIIIFVSPWVMVEWNKKKMREYSGV